jgi:chromosome partitioning protein
VTFAIQTDLRVEGPTVRTVAIVNQKGGCGKTTTAINLAGVLSRKGYRTLLVDMDPQSHCAAGLAIPEGRIDIDIGDAMLACADGDFDRSRLLWRVGRNLDLAPSRMKLAGLEASRGGLADLPDKERALSRVLARLAPDYDACLVDCSPAIGLLTYNALAAATEVLVPVEMGFFSFRGAAKQVETIRTLNRRLGVDTSHWLLPTMHDGESALAVDLLDELRRRFGRKVAPVVIRRDGALQAAIAYGQPVVEFSSVSQGAEDYTALTQWLLDHAWSGRIGGASQEPPTQSLPSEDESDQPTVQVRVGSNGTQGLADRVTESNGVASRAREVAQRAKRLLDNAATRDTEIRIGTNASNGAAKTTTQDADVIRETKPSLPPLHQIQDRMGVRVTRRGVLFVQPIMTGSRVAIAGDFNGWSAESTPMQRNDNLGVFELCMELDPGIHQYRLVIDGQWTADPFNDKSELNPFGEANSVVDVAPKEATATTPV